MGPETGCGVEVGAVGGSVTHSDFEEAWRAAQEGEEWGFVFLYRLMNPPLLRYLYAHVGGQAEDLASEVWLAVARASASFSGDEAGFRAWLFTIARRRVIQLWRERGRKPSLPVAPHELAELAGPGQVTEEAVDKLSAREVAALVTRLLPAAQAEVVLLRVVAGLDVTQVAELLGKRAGTVRVLQHKALRRLATIFSSERVTL